MSEWKILNLVATQAQGRVETWHVSFTDTVPFSCQTNPFQPTFPLTIPSSSKLLLERAFIPFNSVPSRYTSVAILYKIVNASTIYSNISHTASRASLPRVSLGLISSQKATVNLKFSFVPNTDQGPRGIVATNNWDMNWSCAIMYFITNFKTS